MSSSRAVVVGAGIGGLAAAVALRRRGWRVSVLERAERLEPVGAGISLWPNALRALDVLGVGEALRTLAVPAGPSGIRRPDGRWIARSDIGAALAARFGDPLVILHRAELIGLLADRLAPETLRTGVTVNGVDPGDRRRRATVATDGGDLDADLLVAADGIRSTARGVLFPDHPGLRYAGYTSWRAVVSDPGTGGVASETWGRRGERFAMIPMAGGRCYCYATANAPAGVRHVDEVAEVVHRFGAWHDPIPRVVAGLDPSRLHHDDIEEIAEPLPAFHRGRVALIGDAAHAMTPDLGQGGCQAIEDAVVLAAVVGAGHGDTAITAALPRYTQDRQPRGTRIARRSRLAGRFYQSPPAVQELAGRLMGLLPPAAIVRAFAPVVDWRPPG